MDEFRAEFLAQGLILPGELEVIGHLINLAWQPPSERTFDCEAIEHYENEDPAIAVTGYLRLVAFWRIEGEIRYWAGRIEPERLECSDDDPNCVAAADVEDQYYEEAILGSVKDAVQLTFEYLTGKRLPDIEVSRISREGKALGH